MWNPNGYSKDLINHFSGKVIETGFKVHSKLGPGLLESAYEACLKKDLQNMGVDVASQVPRPIWYMGEKVDVGYRVDLLVEKSLIVEIKAVEAVRNIHKAQILSYLKLSGLHLGLLINFNTISLKDGISRIVNGYL